MAEIPRRLRGLVYGLTDVENALRAAGRTAGAQGVAEAARRLGSLSQDQAGAFLDQCREALEAVLLGERDLQQEIIGLVLDVLASLDDVLRESYDKH